MKNEIKILNTKESVLSEVEDIEKNYLCVLRCAVNDSNGRFLGFVGGYSKPKYTVKLELFKPRVSEKSEKPYKKWIKKLSSKCYDKAKLDLENELKFLPPGTCEHAKKIKNKNCVMRLPLMLVHKNKVVRLSK